jgi:hypothetical protein
MLSPPSQVTNTTTDVSPPKTSNIKKKPWMVSIFFGKIFITGIFSSFLY